MLVRRCNLSAAAAHSTNRAAFARHFIGAALLLAILPTNASAVILMEVLDPLTLFKVKGLTFETYATSERASLQIENTDTGHIGPVDILGQTVPRPGLALSAVSRLIPDEKVLIEIDIGPLQEAITPPFVELSGLGMPDQRVITDRALLRIGQPAGVRVRIRKRNS